MLILLLFIQFCYWQGWWCSGMSYVFFFKLTFFNHLSANPTKWSNTFKQFVGCEWQIVWVCYYHFAGLALKGLKHLLQGVHSPIMEKYSHLCEDFLLFCSKGFRLLENIEINENSDTKLINPFSANPFCGASA